MRRVTVAMVGGLALVAAGCTSMGDTMMASPAMGKTSLYDRLGQKPAIAAVVDDFVANVAGDTRINARFQGANIPRLKTMLVDQICQASGGPCTYAGRTMLAAHQGMGIKDAEFSALVEDLVRSLDKFKVPAQEKSELLGALGSMKGDIVGR